MRAHQENKAFSNSPRAPPNMIQSVYTPTTAKSSKISYPHHARQFSHNTSRLPTGLEIERVNTEPAYGAATDIRGYNVNKIPGKIKQFENFFQQNLNHLTEHGLKNINYDTLDHLTVYAQSSKSRVYTDDQDNMLQFTSKTRTEPNAMSQKFSLQPILGASPRHVLALSTLRSPDTSEERRYFDQPQTVRTPSEKKSNSKFKAIEKNIGSMSYRSTSSLNSQDFVQDLYKSRKGENQKKTNLAKVSKKTSELEALIGGPSAHRKRGYSDNNKKSAPQSIFSPAEKQQKMVNIPQFPSIEKDESQGIQSFSDRKGIIENNAGNNKQNLGEGFPGKHAFVKHMHHSISGIEDIRKEQDKNVSSIYTEKPKKNKVVLKKTNSVSSGLRKSPLESPKDFQSDGSLKTLDLEKEKKGMMKKLWIDTDSPELIGTQSSLDAQNSTRLQTKDISTVSTTKVTQMTMSELFMPPAVAFSESANLIFSNERIQSLPDELPLRTSQKFKKPALKNNSTFKHMKSAVADESSDANLIDSKQEQIMRKISAGTPVAHEDKANLQIERNISEPTQLAKESQAPKFNFNKKKNEIEFKHKKIPMRRASGNFDPTAFENRAKSDFCFEFNRMVDVVTQKLYGSAKNDTFRKALLRGGTSDMEGLLRKESEDGIGRMPTKISKNNISDSEFAGSIIRLPTKIDSSGAPSENVLEQPLKEEATPSNRVMYPVKNYVITVNINPPIEEASPRMEESLAPLGSFSNHWDAIGGGKDLEHMKSDEIAMGQSGILTSVSSLSKQYKFEMNAKKHMEELIEEEKSIFGDVDMSIILNEQSFRHNTEVLFKYEGIDNDMLPFWSSIKTLTSVTKANFFTVVEKILWDPIHQKSNLNVLEEVYFTDSKKSSSAGLQDPFRHRPKVKDIIFKFIGEVHASLTDLTNISSIIIEDKNHPEMIEEEKFDTFEIKGKGSILQTSMMIVKEIVPSKINPQMVFMDVAALKRIRDSYAFLDLFKYLCEAETLENSRKEYEQLMRLQKKMNNVNWSYTLRFFNKLYSKVVYGLYEMNIELIKEDCEIKIEPKHSEQENPLQVEKKRRAPRYSTSAAKVRSNGAKILQAATKTIINSLRSSPGSTITSEERKLTDFPTQASDEKPSLNLKYTQFPRRYSKTTIKPNTLGPESLTVERMKTVAVRKQSSMITNPIEHQISLIPNQGNISKGVTLAISEENAMDTSSNQLQIPTETHIANLAKLQSLPNRDDNKSKFSNERSRSRRNIFTTGNTLNTSTRKSLSTNSDSQIQNSAQDVAAVPKPRALSKEPSFSTLFPPKVKGPTIIASPTIIKKLLSKKTKEGEALSLKSPQQNVKNVITKMSVVNSLSENVVHKKRMTTKGVLEESGPRKALFYSIASRNCQEVQGMLDMHPREMINNTRDENENTLLILAAKSGNRALVSLLIDRESDINAQNDEGNTALHVAIQHGLDDIADLLLQSGAKQTIRNHKGRISWEMSGFR